MSATDLIDAPVNYITLAGRRSPGIAKITNAEALRRLHERRAFGVAGASVIDQGGLLAHPQVRLDFFTREDLAGWEDWKTLLARPRSRQTLGQDIEHPLLADLEIRCVLFEGRSQIEENETNGWYVVIKFCEFVRPVPVLSAPSQTIDQHPPNGSDEQIIEAQQREIDQLEDPSAWS